MYNLLLNRQRPTSIISLLMLAAMCMLLLIGCGAEVGSDRKPTRTPEGVGVPTLPPSSSSSGAEPTLEPYTFTDADGMPFPVPSTEANPINVTTKEDAWGNNLDVKEIPSLIDKDHLFLLRAVAADGKLIAGWIAPRSDESKETPRLALMDVATRQITEVATLPAGQDFPYPLYSSWGKIYMDGDWMAWQEGPNLKIYNISTQEHKQIETVSDSRGGIPGFYMLPNAEIVSLDNGIVVWAEGSDETTEAGKLASVIKSIDLTTGIISIIARHGADPHISWPNVSWVEPDLTKEVDGIIYTSAVVLNLTSGEKHYMGSGYDFTILALYEDTMVIGNASRPYLTNLAETRRQVIQPMQDMSFTYDYTLSERLVAWHSDGPQVWDRALHRVVRLGGASDRYGVTTAKGSALAWQATPDYRDFMEHTAGGELPSDFNIYLIDTSQLPK